MNGILKAADIQREALPGLLHDLADDSGNRKYRCWIEAPDGWTFDWWENLDGQLQWYQAGRLPMLISAQDAVQRATAGRVFAPDGEFRWRIIPSLGELSCRCVYLGQAESIGEPLIDHSTELADLTSKRKRSLLWGQQTDVSPGEWIELRIPHRFRYPVDGHPQGVMIETEQWLDAARQPHFIRLCDLCPCEPPH